MVKLPPLPIPCVLVLTLAPSWTSKVLVLIIKSPASPNELGFVRLDNLLLNSPSLLVPISWTSWASMVTLPPLPLPSVIVVTCAPSWTSKVLVLIFKSPESSGESEFV